MPHEAMEIRKTLGKGQDLKGRISEVEGTRKIILFKILMKMKRLRQCRVSYLSKISQLVTSKVKLD